jgi:uncharacterized protein (TIGR02145 family)
MNRFKSMISLKEMKKLVIAFSLMLVPTFILIALPPSGTNNSPYYLSWILYDGEWLINNSLIDYSGGYATEIRSGSATITNNSGAVLYGAYGAIDVYSSATGTLTNFGYLFGTVTNYGTIRAGENATLILNNYGKISTYVKQYFPTMIGMASKGNIGILLRSGSTLSLTSYAGSAIEGGYADIGFMNGTYSFAGKGIGANNSTLTLSGFTNITAGAYSVFLENGSVMMLLPNSNTRMDGGSDYPPTDIGDVRGIGGIGLYADNSNVNVAGTLTVTGTLQAISLLNGAQLNLPNAYRYWTNTTTDDPGGAGKIYIEGVTGFDPAFTNNSTYKFVKIVEMPTMNKPSNQNICNASPTTAVNFSGTPSGVTYEWTNDKPGIGLAASGDGNISSFNAINTGTSAIIATIEVTPKANGISGIPVSFTITVNPDNLIVATAVGDGTISPSGNYIVPCGENITFNFVPNSGSSIDSVFVDGAYNALAVSNGFYTFNNVKEEHTIEVYFKSSSCPSTITYQSHNYKVTNLAGLCWTETMRNTKYADDTDIPFAKPYQNKDEYTEIFGLLYDYESASGGQICPAGWRMPTSTEWLSLNMYNMKELRNPAYWLSPNSNTNSEGFDLRASGFFNSTSQCFEELYGIALYWSSDITTSSTFILGVCNTYFCPYLELKEIKKTDAVSVRCVKE